MMRVTHWEFTIQSSLLKTAKSAPVIVVFGRVGVLVSRIIRPNLDTLVANSRVLPQNKTSKSCHLLFERLPAAMATFALFDA